MDKGVGGTHSLHLEARPHLLPSESARVEQVHAGEEAGWGAWSPLATAPAGLKAHRARGTRGSQDPREQGRGHQLGVREGLPG